jgi:hypothetical protein
MPLVHLSGVTPTSTFFIIGYCFVPVEVEEEYYFVLDVYKDLRLPILKIFILDNYDALKRATKELYLNVPQLLCTWHLNKNLEAHIKKKWNKSGYTEDELLQTD